MSLLQHWKVTILGWKPMNFSLAVCVLQIFIFWRTYVRLYYITIGSFIGSVDEKSFCNEKIFCTVYILILVLVLFNTGKYISTKLDSWTVFFMKMKIYSKIKTWKNTTIREVKNRNVSEYFPLCLFLSLLLSFFLFSFFLSFFTFFLYFLSLLSFFLEFLSFFLSLQLFQKHNQWYSNH